jgi:hypothetical protein
MPHIASSMKPLTNSHSQPTTNSTYQSQLRPIEAVAELSISYRSIESLKPYPGNARTHTPAQIRKLKESIRVFGFVNPVLIHTDGTIIAGHGRVQAAKLLGMTELPTICLESLTPDQVRAYVIADNRLAQDAGWDEQILKIELQHLSLITDFDVTITGFEIPEVDIILGAESTKDDPADQIPEEDPRTITQPGDMWALGRHRIFCGDARSESSFTELMGKSRAAVVFSDPPYNVVIDGHATGKGKVRHREFAMASGEMSEGEFTDFLTSALGQLANWSAEGSVHFIAMDWRHMPELLAAGRKVYDSLLNLCVWSKDNGGMGSLYRSQHELFFVFKSGKGSHRNQRPAREVRPQPHQCVALSRSQYPLTHG